MKIAFDVDVLAKQMDINRMVHQVADWGYKYIEQSPHPRINPFYKHPLFSKECEQEYRQALKETGVEISSFIVVYRWSGPTEEQRQFAVANWKRMIQIAGDMGVKVINTELSGDPNQQEICNGMWFRSMEELLPLIEREGIRVEIQSHPYDFCELNNETCDMVKSFRSPNLGYVYSSPHGFFYDEGKGDVRSMLKYAGDELTHVLFADTFNQTMDCRYILNPPWLNGRGKADVTVHQHLAMGEGDVDFDGIFEILREMDFASKQLKPNAPKAGGEKRQRAGRKGRRKSKRWNLARSAGKSEGVRQDHDGGGDSGGCIKDIGNRKFISGSRSASAGATATRPAITASAGTTTTRPAVTASAGTTTARPAINFNVGFVEKK